MCISRRNTYLFGAAAVLAGIVLIVVAIVVSGDDGTDGPAAGTGRPAEGRQAAPGVSGAEGAALAKQVGRRMRVPAPVFSLALIQDGTPPPQAREALERAARSGDLDLAGLTGTPVVLHVWSSGCTPCRADARLVQTTWERWGRRGVAFVGLSVDRREQDARRFASQYGWTYPVVHDPGALTANRYGVTRLPETFFISASGEVVGHVVGSPSVRQMEFGAAAARSARRIGSERGAGSVPLR